MFASFGDLKGKRRSGKPKILKTRSGVNEIHYRIEG